MFLVVDGELRMDFRDRQVKVGPGEMIVVPRGVPHQLINDADGPARCFIVFSSPDRQFEAVE